MHGETLKLAKTLFV